MNRSLSSVETAPVVSNTAGPATPVAAHLSVDQGNAAQVAAPPRNDQYRGSSYVGKSYLGRSRRSSSAGRQSMFRIG